MTSVANFSSFTSWSSTPYSMFVARKNVSASSPFSTWVPSGM